MDRVLSCIIDEHNPWLLAAAVVVVGLGSLSTMRLFQRAMRTSALVSLGWTFLTAVTAGTTIWSTHFVAMLAYHPDLPVSFDPILTMASLVLAIFGAAVGFLIAARRGFGWAPEVGGAILGLSVAAMHYAGVMGYSVAGLRHWDERYVLASLLLSTGLATLAISRAMRPVTRWCKHGSAVIFAAAVLALHFTGTAALTITPLSFDAQARDPIVAALALAVAFGTVLVLGAGLVSYLIDDKNRHEAFEKLEHLAHTDSLTGLPNRFTFNTYLDYELDRAADSVNRVALILIDLDRFKEINDRFGHQAGDFVLKILSRRMEGVLQPGEFVSRLGGDEFAAVKFSDSVDAILDFAGRLERVLSDPIVSEDFHGSPCGSLGVAIYPRDGRNKEDLIANADLAMYRAKADPLRSICIYEPAMDVAARKKRGLLSDLRHALARDELSLRFQVQADVQTGAVTGFEVLLRWQHPVHGFVPPSDFIPLAEEAGLILPIGEWVLRKACAEAATWSDKHKIAVNLSPVQISHAELPALVEDVLRETGLEPARLELEITESTIIGDKQRALDMLRQIRSLGVSVALDDFGTGYSSLETLRAFPFDKIKLDRFFISEIDASPEAKAILRAVLALGRSLVIPILAEGVETEHQLEILRQEGCEEAQGYLLGKPALAADLAPLLTHIRPARPALALVS